MRPIAWHCLDKARNLSTTAIPKFGGVQLEIPALESDVELACTEWHKIFVPVNVLITCTYMYLHILVALGLCSVVSDYMMFKLSNYFFIFFYQYGNPF